MRSQNPLLKLAQPFFESSTLTLARKLLGQKLCAEIDNEFTSGMIVEVEAYLGENDLACHAARGKTERNGVMFKSAGHCYVYLIYGMHHCINVVSDAEGTGSAVLIRAVEPLDGIETMCRRRGAKGTSSHQITNLTNGPGKLCQAFGISRSLSGEHFVSSAKVSLESYQTIYNDMIVASPRIGISQAKEHEWRFSVRGNPYVSRG